mmetsp:Transcript_56960/g.159860  ORF Transcript_56960/g.159860 Transcript_56960/m.159860 type:complete len:211 (+) Transcript_56960:97-729(+)
MGCAAGVCPCTRRWIQSRCCVAVLGSSWSQTRSEVEHIPSAPSNGRITSRGGISVGTTPSGEAWAETSSSLPPGKRPGASRSLRSAEASPHEDLVVTSFSSQKMIACMRDDPSMESDVTDPDMPELLPARCATVRSNRSCSSLEGNHGSRPVSGSQDRDADPASWRNISGGLDSCWGSSALKHALTDMETVQDRRSEVSDASHGPRARSA